MHKHTALSSSEFSQFPHQTSLWSPAGIFLYLCSIYSDKSRFGLFWGLWVPGTPHHHHFRDPCLSPVHHHVSYQRATHAPACTIHVQFFYALQSSHKSAGCIACLLQVSNSSWKSTSTNLSNMEVAESAKGLFTNLHTSSHQGAWKIFAYSAWWHFGWKVYQLGQRVKEKVYQLASTQVTEQIAEMPLQLCLAPPTSLSFSLFTKTYLQIQVSHFSDPLQKTLSNTSILIHSLYLSCSVSIFVAIVLKEEH